MLKLVKKHQFLCIIMLLIIMLSLCAISIFNFRGNPVNASGVYGTGINADGLTYGSAAEAKTPEEEPDLIAVEATNGKIGYVFKTDLEYAEGDYISNPDEAIAYTEKRDANASEAFSNYINKKLGTNIKMNILQYEKIKNDFEVKCISGEKIMSDLGINVMKVKSVNTDEVLKEALLEAQEANTETINVYEKDGKTKIGVFIVN